MVTARFLRTFAQSSIAVFFAIYLDSLGYSLPQIGLLVTAGSVGSTVFAFLIVFIGESLGRRRLLIGFSLMMGFAGLGFALTDRYLLLASVQGCHVAHTFVDASIVLALQETSDVSHL